MFVAPGNAGTEREPNLTNVDIAAEEIDGLLNFAKQENIGLTIVGPEGQANRYGWLDLQVKECVRAQELF